MHFMGCWLYIWNSFSVFVSMVKFICNIEDINYFNILRSCFVVVLVHWWLFMLVGFKTWVMCVVFRKMACSSFSLASTDVTQLVLLLLYSSTWSNVFRLFSFAHILICFRFIEKASNQPHRMVFPFTWDCLGLAVYQVVLTGFHFSSNLSTDFNHPTFKCFPASRVLVLFWYMGFFLLLSLQPVYIVTGI